MRLKGAGYKPGVEPKLGLREVDNAAEPGGLQSCPHGAFCILPGGSSL